MLRIVCDKTIHGRSLAIVPRGDLPHGYVDIDEDNFKHNPYLQRLQQVMVGAVQKASKAEFKTLKMTNYSTEMELDVLKPQDNVLDHLITLVVAQYCSASIGRGYRWTSLAIPIPIRMSGTS